ncbi:MAG: hypothetical protein M1840_002745 [Geoglossum simile]|nr:MAG: hypothetical protein M1840_002745 [Geoglossum simile]
MYLRYNILNFEVGADQKAWFLGITNGSHAGTHDMVPNPLAYSLYAKRQPQYAAAIQQAITLRVAQISYSQASRIMAVQDLKLDRNAFYNTQRSSNKQQDGPELLPLFDFLNEKRYHIRSRYRYEMDSTTAEPISRQLEQLFFMSDSQIQLPLTILTSISNTGDSFPMAFCFLPSESKEEYPPPIVIVGDQAKGLSSSLPYSMPGSIGQFCKWHAFENIKKHLMDYGYAKKKINTTKPLIWNYLQANTSSTLTAARTKLFKALKSPEVRYIKNNWVTKEDFVCRSLTEQMANLGVYSTQRAESMNAVLKKTLNRQISLLEACRRLVKVVESFEAKLLEAETMSMTYRARILDMNGFATILGKVTSYAIGLMAPEWAAACVPRPDSIWRGSCLHNCSFPLRYGLPCRHWMTRSVLEGFPLPISLVHPCWWLSGSPVLGGGWVMGYHNAAIDPQERWVGGFRNRGKDIVMESVQHLLKHQSQLLPEQSEHLMRRMVNNNNQILAEIHALKARDEEIPSELPPPLPSNLSLQARKQKGSTRKRALTGAEASERQQKAMTRAQTRARAAREVQSTQEGVAVTFKRRTRSQKDADLLEDQLQKDTAKYIRVRLSELDVLIRLPGDRPILTLFDPILCGTEPDYHRSLPVDTAFIKAHGILFTGVSLDCFSDVVDRFLSLLDNNIGRVTSKWKEQGIYIAVANFAALFGYASKDNLLRRVYAMEQSNTREVPPDAVSQHDVKSNLTDSGPRDRAYQTASSKALGRQRSRALGEVGAEDSHETSKDATAFANARFLTFATLDLALQRLGDPNVLPHVHISLVFMNHITHSEPAMNLVEEAFP